MLLTLRIKVLLDKTKIVLNLFLKHSKVCLKKTLSFFELLLPIGWKLVQLAFYLKFLEWILEAYKVPLLTAIEFVLLLTLKIAVGSVLPLACLVSVLSFICPKALPVVWYALSKGFLCAKRIAALIGFFEELFTLSFITDHERGQARTQALGGLIGLMLADPIFCLLGLLIMIYIAIVKSVRIVFHPIVSLMPLKYLCLRVFMIARTPMKKGSAYSQDCLEALIHAIQNGYIDRVKVFLAGGVEANQLSLLAPTKTVLSYAIENSDIQMVKLLISAGADLTTENLKGNFREMLISEINSYNRAGVIELLKLLSEEQMNLMLENSILSKNPIVAQFRLKIELFDSVWTTVKTMRQVDPSFAEPAVIRDHLLPMFKPEWCSEGEYKKLSEDVFKKTLMALDKLDNRKAKSAQQKQESSNILTPLAAGPVVFRGDENPQAANEAIIDVLPKKSLRLK